jgi:hypothetical protein
MCAALGGELRSHQALDLRRHVVAHPVPEIKTALSVCDTPYVQIDGHCQQDCDLLDRYPSAAPFLGERTWYSRDIPPALRARSIGNKVMRGFLLVTIAIASFAGALTAASSEANAVFWRGITAPTNIDIHGWPIIKEPPPSPCHWIRLSGGYWVRQCVPLD